MRLSILKLTEKLQRRHRYVQKKPICKFFRINSSPMLTFTGEAGGYPGLCLCRFDGVFAAVSLCALSERRSGRRTGRHAAPGPDLGRISTALPQTESALPLDAGRRIKQPPVPEGLFRTAKRVFFTEFILLFKTDSAIIRRKGVYQHEK